MDKEELVREMRELARLMLVQIQFMRNWERGILAGWMMPEARRGVWLWRERWPLMETALNLNPSWCDDEDVRAARMAMVSVGEQVQAAMGE